MDDADLPAITDLPVAETDCLDDQPDESDDDGLGSSGAAESHEELFLREGSVVEEETSTSRAGELKILHASGASKLKREL